MTRLHDMSSHPEPVNSPEVTAFLRERYGKSGKNGKSNWRSGWKLPAALLALTGGAWLIWSAAHAATPEIRSTLISFKSLSSTSIQIRYSVQIKDPARTHQCTLVARDGDKNTVGEIVDQIPLGVASTTREVIIPSRLQAVNAGIASCTSL